MKYNFFLLKLLNICDNLIAEKLKMILKNGKKIEAMNIKKFQRSKNKN